MENPKANASSFFLMNGAWWFLTGDVGVLDEDGHLRLTGRSKLIKRGGEQISPHEVEDALTEHRLVETAAVLAVPSELWGEEVGVAVVPAEPEELPRDERVAWSRRRFRSVVFAPARRAPSAVDERRGTAGGRAASVRAIGESRGRHVAESRRRFRRCGVGGRRHSGHVPRLRHGAGQRRGHAEKRPVGDAIVVRSGAAAAAGVTLTAARYVFLLS
mmetsp:Transcript_23621/g.72661  ORF Transcript_23621/g.72661 Transcript_23621/m.72661 type:complete len:216 (-) Transcript_23621:276-923(-)